MNEKPQTYEFDDVRVDLQAFKVFKAAAAVQLEPKAIEVLVFLIEQRGRLIEKRELLDAVWKDACVTENAMTRVIAHCRTQLPSFKIPKSIEFFDALPKGGTGKILKQELREKYWRGYEKRVH